MNILAYIRTGLAALNEILQAGGSAFALLNELDTTLRAMQAEHRDPTEAEWAAMNARIAAALATLQT